MEIEEQLFAQKKVVIKQLLSYGFTKGKANQYSLKINFFRNRFTAILTVDVHSKVREK